MIELTDDLRLRMALTEHAEQRQPGGLWYLHADSGAFGYNETNALRLVKIGLALGTTPSGILSAEMFERLVDRIVAIEQRLAEVR